MISNNNRRLFSGRMHWRVIALLVCLYGFAKEFRPIMPFITPYLQGPEKNFTSAELYGDIFPYWTYSFLLFSIPVFFFTDLLRYKPVMIVEALMLTCVWGLFVWGTTVWQMTLAYLLYGVASASETAYYSYLYAVVDKEHYKTVTSYTRTSIMLGQFFAYSGGQIAYSAGWTSYKFLNDFSFGAEIFALAVALLSPSVKRKLPELEVVEEGSGAEKSNSSDSVEIADETKSPEKYLNPTENIVVNELEAITPAIVEIPEKNEGFIQEMKKSIPKIMSNRIVITWSLWWILTSGMISQLYNYIQILWSTMQDGDNDVYNGVVASVQTAGGAIITFSLQYITFEWEKHSEIVSFITSIFFAASFFSMAVVWNIYIHYVIYLMACFCYAILITVAMTVIASQLDSAAYGLVFGANTFFATLLQSVITFVIVDSNCLNLAIRTQFEVYAVCFAILALFFLVIRIQKCFVKDETVEEDQTPL